MSNKEDIGGFVFYKSFLDAMEGLTDEDFGKAVRSLCNYAFFDEQNLEGLSPIAKAVCLVSIPIINSSMTKYKRAKAGGTKKAENQKKNDSSTNLSTNLSRKLSRNLSTNVSSVLKNVPNNNININTNINTNTNTEADESASEEDARASYARNVYNLWKSHNLPCSKDEITFSMRDMREGLEAIHKGNYTSQEVEEACKNYIKELEASDSFVTSKMTFAGFCKSKLFSKCLPDLYRHENFQNFKKDEEEEEDSGEIRFPELDMEELTAKYGAERI